MTDVSGLSSLTEVGASLNSERNDALADVSGLTSLPSVGGDLVIRWNAAQVNVTGLSSLTSVGGDLDIANNSALCQSLVDALVAALGTGLSGVVADITGNDESC